MNDTSTITIDRSISSYYVDGSTILENEIDNLNDKINELTKEIDKLKKRRSHMNFRKRNKRIKIKY